MKKLIAILLCALLALVPALAEAPTETPAPQMLPFELPTATEEPTAAPTAPGRDPSSGDTFELQTNNGVVLLDFDTSPQYSSISDGLVQASFYKYADDGMLYELYIIFPETAQPGMVITPDYTALTNEESSVVLIVSDTQTQQEQYFLSTQMNGTVYPVGSDFSICVDEIHELDGGVSYVGRLSATLIALDMTTGEVLATMTIPETPFGFTFGSGSEERHADPIPTPTPKDMVRT